MTKTIRMEQGKSTTTMDLDIKFFSTHTTLYGAEDEEETMKLVRGTGRHGKQREQVNTQKDYNDKNLNEEEEEDSTSNLCDDKAMNEEMDLSSGTEGSSINI